MTLKSAALAYASRGWPVFPCNPQTGAPLVGRDLDASGVELPNTGGVRKATTDANIVASWWDRWPRALIAAAAGAPIGAFVLDVDVKSPAGDGKTTLAELEDERGALPETWESETPSGGAHLYFRQPARTLRNRVGFAPGLDVRSTGASITLPPSRKPHGVYRWRLSPDDTPLAVAPEWLLGLIAPPAPPRRTYRPMPGTSDRYGQAALRAECEALAAMAPNTGRNQRLFQAAARLAELSAAGLLQLDHVEAELESAATACGLHLDDSGLAGVRATIASGLRRGQERPRGPRPRSAITPAMRALIARQAAE